MKDYWDFPAVRESFTNTTYGKFQEIDGLLWRVRGGDYLLVSAPTQPFKLPENLKRGRSLSYLSGKIGDSIPVKNAGWVYECEQDWTANRKTRYSLRLAERDGAVLITPTRDQIRDCFYAWVKDMQTHNPNKMLVKGHYLEMIDHPGFTFLACQCGDKVIGATGFTKDGNDGAVCFTKHERGVWWLSRYLWFHSLKSLQIAGVSSINCGDTADKLKKELGLKQHRQFKVDFNALHV